MKQIALLGATASGKSALSLKLAKKMDAYILSLDSLSIYKEIDIASAKPSTDERGEVRHFGIDVINVDELFDVTRYFDIYKNAKEIALRDAKNLIIVGGSGFYLKMLLDGVSSYPQYSVQTKDKTRYMLEDLEIAYALIQSVDNQYAKKIASQDKYRIEKWLNLYHETGIGMSVYVDDHPPIKIIEDINIYELDKSRDVLKTRIEERTDKMIQNGLIDEVVYLDKKYTRTPNAMKSIGIKEVLEFLDAKTTKAKMVQSIVTNTAKLAKRQQVFNKTQFKTRKLMSENDILREIDQQ